MVTGAHHHPEQLIQRAAHPMRAHAIQRPTDHAGMPGRLGRSEHIHARDGCQTIVHLLQQPLYIVHGGGGYRLLKHRQRFPPGDDAGDVGRARLPARRWRLGDEAVKVNRLHHAAAQYGRGHPFLQAVAEGQKADAGGTERLVR